MKAVICTEYGGPEVLKVQQINKPVVKDDQILIKIKASAVTVSDTVIRKLEAPGNPGPVKKKLMEAGMRIALGFNRPNNPILGMVAVGVVDACGPEVKLFKVGDEVLSFSGNKMSGYAEYKIASEKEVAAGALIHKPTNMGFEETAALAYGGVLTMHFMEPSMIKTGDHVLIYGASGAIGTMAIQLAKAQGARVTAICSEKNFDLVQSLGADKTIDYNDPSAVNHLMMYDLIFDAVGHKKSSAIKEKMASHLADGGREVSVDDAMMKQKPSYLRAIKQFAEEGQIEAVIDKIFKLDNIVEAHIYVDLGHKKGNVVITI